MVSHGRLGGPHGGADHLPGVARAGARAGLVGGQGPPSSAALQLDRTGGKGRATIYIRATKTICIRGTHPSNSLSLLVYPGQGKKRKLSKYSSNVKLGSDRLDRLNIKFFTLLLLTSCQKNLHICFSTHRTQKSKQRNICLLLNQTSPAIICSLDLSNNQLKMQNQHWICRRFLLFFVCLQFQVHLWASVFASTKCCKYSKYSTKFCKYSKYSTKYCKYSKYSTK